MTHVRCNSRFSSRMTDLGRNDVLVTRDIYHDMRYSTVEYNRHVGQKRNYRPTVSW